jgi:exonuclease III
MLFFDWIIFMFFHIILFCYFFIINFLMKVITWNCRGAQGKKFRRALTNFCRSNKVDLVALQETRCSGIVARNTIKNLGFKYSLLAEARGFSGGIWLMWNRTDIKIHLIKTDFHFLHVQVQEGNMEPWQLTVVYASPREHERSDTWHQIHHLSTTITSPWLVMGDFNEIASPDEKKGGVQADIRKCLHFNNWINECSLMESLLPAQSLLGGDRIGRGGIECLKSWIVFSVMFPGD